MPPWVWEVEIVLFVGSFATNAHNMPFLWNKIRLVLSTKLQKHIKTSGFGHHKMFQQLFRKYVVRHIQAVQLMHPGKEVVLINQCFAKNTLHSNDLLTSHTVNNYEFFVPIQ